VEEQADDAAGLITALGLGPVGAFSGSSGATIALELALGHADLVRGVVLHEPDPYIAQDILGDQLPALLGQLMATLQPAMDPAAHGQRSRPSSA
jgi:pimeloyl-ACP methyl ester carboxylesterase